MKNRLANTLLPHDNFSPKIMTLPRWDHVSQSMSRTALLNNVPTVEKGLRTILVPLDGSVFAEHAIPFALGVAEQYGAALQLVHVMKGADMDNPFDALRFSELPLKARELEKHRYLTGIAQRIASNGSVMVSPRTVVSNTVLQALNETIDLNADAVVMATHGRSPIGRFWWGGIAHPLLKRISVPLFIVRGQDTSVRLSPRKVEHVILPVHNSHESRQLVPTLLSKGLLPGTIHTLLRVNRLQPTYAAQYGIPHTVWLPSHRDVIAGMKQMRPLASALRERGRKVHTKTITSNEPIAEAVLGYAERTNADLITLSCGRRGLLSRLLRPSVSEYLFQHSTRPLLFVPANQ
ncbi:MAG: universal stress protein [Planctomycetes bacterium]|nr:universal stress protein [Planctomycetota bacterium]